jgi:hypothetical protein
MVGLANTKHRTVISPLGVSEGAFIYTAASNTGARTVGRAILLHFRIDSANWNPHNSQTFSHEHDF